MKVSGSCRSELSLLLIWWGFGDDEADGFLILALNTFSDINERSSSLRNGLVNLTSSSEVVDAAA